MAAAAAAAVAKFSSCKRIAKWMVCNLSYQISSSVNLVGFKSVVTQSDPNLPSFCTTESDSLSVCFNLPYYRSVGRRRPPQRLSDNPSPPPLLSTNAYFREILKQGVMGNIEEMENLCYEINNEQPLTFTQEEEEALTKLILDFRSNHISEEGFWALQLLNHGKLPIIIMHNSCLYLDILNDYLNYLCHRHQLSKALTLFHQISSPNPQTFEIMISPLCTKFFLEECIEVLDKMLQFECIPQSLNFYNKLIPFMCESGHEERAFQLFTMIKGLGFKPGYLIYQALIKSFGSTFDNSCHSLQLVNEMIIQCGYPPNAYFLAPIFRLLRVEEAADFLDNKFLHAPPYLHNIILDVCCRNRKFNQATDYFDKMLEKNVANMESWSILIKRFRGSGQNLKATEILKRAVPFPGCITQSAAYYFLVKEINQSTIKFAELIRLYSLAYQFAIPCNPSVYNNMLLSLYQLGRTKAALLLFSRMLIMGCGLNAEAGSVLIHCMCKENKTVNCAHLFDLMVSDGMVPNSETLGRLLHYMACQSQLHIVMPALHKIASEDGVLCLAMYYMLFRGLWKEALSMFGQGLYGWSVSVVGRRR